MVVGVLVTLSSASGAPGVSAWALALAVALPGRRPRVLLEADLSGGVLSGRYGFPSDPGAGSLVAAIGQRPYASPDPSAHGRRLAPGLSCVAGPPTAGPSQRLWRSATSVVPQALAADSRLWLVDCGRVDVRGLLAPVLERAMAHLVVVAGSRAALVKAGDHAARLPGGARVGLLVPVPTLPDRDDLPTLGQDDAIWAVVRPPSLGVLAIRSLHSRRARRTRAWRGVDGVATAVGRWLLVPPPPPKPER